jgi:hypothetical protein
MPRSIAKERENEMSHYIHYHEKASSKKSISVC